MSELATDYTTIRGCRSCSYEDLSPVLDLGLMPLSDGLFSTNANRNDEPVYPLTLVRCGRCSLVQIRETVDRRTLFGDDYPYYSSYSDALVEHARLNVEGIIERTQVGAESLVVEIASNDGYLLQWFAKEGISVLGIDPAPGPTRVAVERGIPTICEFFDRELATRLTTQGTRADVIIGNNVLAHVPDPNAFVEAMATLLSSEGIIVMEFPYVRDLIDRAEFDTIYHEHHCYFSLTAIRELFQRHELDVVRVEPLTIHGGSLRVFFDRDTEPEPNVETYLEDECRLRLTGHDYYAQFAHRVRQIRSDLVALLDRLHTEGAHLAAYAAAAKGTILLNYCGIGPERLEYVVDRNVHKHGLEMPGVALPIVGVERLAEDPPDYLLLLAWNFKDEIMSQQSEFAERGGRFIVPIPTPAVV